MRSTRAAAAIARLNTRSGGQDYRMVITGGGLIKLQQRTDGLWQDQLAALPLDEFVALVDGLGPQKVRRVTKNDVAFAKQLLRKGGTGE